MATMQQCEIFHVVFLSVFPCYQPVYARRILQQGFRAFSVQQSLKAQRKDSPASGASGVPKIKPSALQQTEEGRAKGLATRVTRTSKDTKPEALSGFLLCWIPVVIHLRPAIRRGNLASQRLKGPKGLGIFGMGFIGAMGLSGVV